MTRLTIIVLSLSAALLRAHAQSQYQDQSQSQSASGSQQSQQDANFVLQASHDNLAEMELSKLGDKSENNQIKQLARDLESSHKSANQELKTLAQKQGFQLTKGVSRHYREQLRQLEGMRGNEFDKQFAAVALIDHGRAIQLYQKEAQQGQNPELKQYAQKQLPELRQHLQMTQTAAKDVGLSGKDIAALLKEYPAAIGGSESPGSQGQGAGSSQGGQNQPPSPQP